MDVVAGVPKGTCYRLRREGVISDYCTRLGNAYYVEEHDIPRLCEIIVETAQARTAEWVSVAEAAQACGLRATTMYTLADRGKVRSRKVGRRVDIFLPSVHAYSRSVSR
jgi:hypothetical protein